MSRRFHEVANIFPLMQGDEFAALKADIAENGQREPIWVHPDGSIIDGRNRYRACLELDMQPVLRTWDGKGSLVSFVVSLNLHRRHLTPMQRAAVAVEALPLLEEEGRRRQSEAAKHTNARRYGPVMTELMEASPLIADNVRRSEQRKTALKDTRHMYFVRSGDKVKIGVSVSPEDRLRQIKTSNPDAELFDYIPVPDGIEPEIHKELAEWNVGGEWFQWSEDVQEKIKSLIAFSKNGKSERTPFRAAKQAAKLASVSTGYVADAKRYKKEVPEVYEMAKAGTVNGSEAKQLANLDNASRAAALRMMGNGTAETVRDAVSAVRRQDRVERAKNIKSLPKKVYNVLYVDPPWEYSNTGVHGAANHHYNTMSTESLMTLLQNIGLEVADDAVLFIWITNPLLAEAFEIIERWGFTYKTNMVWIKTELQKPGSGFYVRGRHELLFICTRGSFTPLDQNIAPPIGSVVESPVREHSRKPEIFYEIIERLYPECSYMELFARTHRDGWDAWGDQVDNFSN